MVGCDYDSYDESNIIRQLLCTENNIGQSKVQAASKRALAINSKINIITFQESFSLSNGVEILQNCDLVIDAVDSVKSKAIIASLCKTMDIPLIHGAIHGWYGQVSTILPGDDTLDKLYGLGDNLTEDLGNPSFTPATIASFQVSEALKTILGRGDILKKKVLFIDMLNLDFEIISLD